MQNKQIRKTDRRTLYTRQIIQEAFLSLLEKKSLEKITVTDICELAEIHRSTFYLHYADSLAVFEALEDELYEKTISYINSMADVDNRINLSTTIYEMLCNDQIFVRIVNNRSSRFIKRISEYGKKRFVKSCLQAKQLDYKKAELLATYVVNGCIAVSMEWFTNGYNNLDEENRFLNKIVTEGLSIIDMKAFNQEFSDGIKFFASNEGNSL